MCYLARASAGTDLIAALCIRAAWALPPARTASVSLIG
jgi:hypothetical protein